MHVSGDAIWTHRQQRVHARLPVSVQCRPGICCCTCQCHPATQVTLSEWTPTTLTSVWPWCVTTFAVFLYLHCRHRRTLMGVTHSQQSGKFLVLADKFLVSKLCGLIGRLCFESFSYYKLAPNGAAFYSVKIRETWVCVTPVIVSVTVCVTRCPAIVLCIRVYMLSLSACCRGRHVSLSMRHAFYLLPSILTGFRWTELYIKHS